MDKARVIHIIQTMPYADLLEFLFTRVNLSDKERRLIDLRMKEGFTQEQVAEKIGRSPRHVRELEDKAFTKIVNNWAGLSFLQYF